jgi:hypothetical protein
MKTTSTQLPIFSIKQRKEKIDPKPAFQRNAVWPLEKKQLLIDSLLRGYDIPKIYLRMLNNNEKYESEVVDGQQRLRTIWEFLENSFPLGRESIDFEEMDDLDGKYYEDLSSAQKDLILSFSLSISEIRDASESQVRELFLRLQEGVSLLPPEKRNAMVGDMRNFIQEISQLPIFLKTSVSNQRLQHADYASHVVAIELANGPCDTKAADLKKMYETNENFEMEGKKAKKIKTTLSYMNKIFDEICPELAIKWGFVDLYYLVSSCMEQYNINGRHKDFFDFYIGFEKERNSVSDPSDLLAIGHTPLQKDLYDYIMAFKTEGAKRANIEIRAQVYMKRMLDSFLDLVPKDPTRAFSETERIVIWRKAFMKCQSCHLNIRKLDGMHADHMIPHSKGGKTTIDNAQCLCRACNLKKSNG